MLRACRSAHAVAPRRSKHRSASSNDSRARLAASACAGRCRVRAASRGPRTAAASAGAPSPRCGARPPRRRADRRPLRAGLGIAHRLRVPTVGVFSHRVAPDRRRGGPPRASTRPTATSASITSGTIRSVAGRIPRSLDLDPALEVLDGALDVADREVEQSERFEAPDHGGRRLRFCDGKARGSDRGTASASPRKAASIASKSSRGSRPPCFPCGWRDCGFSAGLASSAASASCRPSIRVRRGGTAPG